MHGNTDFLLVDAVKKAPKQGEGKSTLIASRCNCAISIRWYAVACIYVERGSIYELGSILLSLALFVLWSLAPADMIRAWLDDLFLRWMWEAILSAAVIRQLYFDRKLIERFLLSLFRSYYREVTLLIVNRSKSIGVALVRRRKNVFDAITNDSIHNDLNDLNSSSAYG